MSKKIKIGFFPYLLASTIPVMGVMAHKRHVKHLNANFSAMLYELWENEESRFIPSEDNAVFQQHKAYEDAGTLYQIITPPPHNAVEKYRFVDPFEYSNKCLNKATQELLEVTQELLEATEKEIARRLKDQD